MVRRFQGGVPWQRGLVEEKPLTVIQGPETPDLLDVRVSSWSLKWKKEF